MGSGASKRNIVGISQEDHLLYSPALLDLQHGTIRHRDRELAADDTIRQGYFYHAQLSDWTDDNCIKDFQKKNVVSAVNNNKLFYVYAVGLDTEVEDTGIQKVKPKPKGLGYRWRGNSQYRYYRLRFSRRREDEDSDSEKEEVKACDTVYRLHPKEGLTVHSISEMIGMKLLIPSYRIAIIYQTTKLQPSTVVSTLNPEYYGRCKLELKIMADVEIVKHGYDDDEPATENTFRIKHQDNDNPTSSSTSGQNSTLHDEQRTVIKSNTPEDVISDKSGGGEKANGVSNNSQNVESPDPEIGRAPRHSSPLQASSEGFAGARQLSQVFDDSASKIEVDSQARGDVGIVPNSDDMSNIHYKNEIKENTKEPMELNKEEENSNERRVIDEENKETVVEEIISISNKVEDVKDNEHDEVIEIENDEKFQEKVDEEKAQEINSEEKAEVVVDVKTVEEKFHTNDIEDASINEDLVRSKLMDKERKSNKKERAVKNKSKKAIA